MTREWLISVLSLAGFLGATYLLFTYALPLVLPFVIAVLAAELIDPLVARFTWRGKLSRSVAVGLVLLLFVGLTATGVTVAAAHLVQEIQGASAQLPYLYARGVDMATGFADQFGAFHAALPGTMKDMMTRNLSSLQNALSGGLLSMASGVGAIAGLPSLVTNALIAIVATFFISRDRREIFDFLLGLFPAVWRPKIQQVKAGVWVSAIGYAKAQLTLILLTMAQSVIGLALIGADYALLVGTLVGLADVMPLLGPAAIYLPWIAYSFVFGSKVFGIKLLILYAVVAGVRQVLEAKLVSDQIGLHPLGILISIYLGFQFFGALGFVVGPLIAVLLKTMVSSGLLPAMGQGPPDSA